MQQKAMIEYKKLLGNTVAGHALSEIEMKLLYAAIQGAIRRASRGGICLADSEAQGSAVRQSLCADCQAKKPA
jgi:hypothetical protein